MRSQTAIFSKLVGDFMGRVPLAVPTGTPCSEMIERMAQAEASSATVTDAAGCPVGIITEHDVTCRIAFKVPPETPVDKVMTAPVMSIPAGEYLYYAIARMRRRRLRHMVVVDEDGRLAGMLDLHHAMAVAAERLMGQIDILTREDSVEGLKHIKAAQVDLAEQLIEDNLPVPEIQALLTHINRDIHRRIVNLNLAAMEAEGYGAPPVGFCVIVMGSGGRGENFLYPDQDNGFILEDYPDRRHSEIDAWFIELAERMVRDLDDVGFPLCKASVMATNPLWRKTLSQWKEQILIWGRKHSTTALRLCDIFFDFRPVWGDTAMAAELRHHVTGVAKANPMFLRALYEDDADAGVALGLFGRFITQKEDKDYLGYMNLKQTGTVPLVEAMRLLCLREGIEANSTLERMEALHAKGVLDDDDYDYLSGAFRHITGILLRQQIADFKAGRRVTYFVHPDSLTERERDILVDSFKAIRQVRARMRAEFTADIF